MLDQLFTEVNKEVLLAHLRGFASRGFSGDIIFQRTHTGREIVRRVTTTYVPVKDQPARDEKAALASVEAYWPSAATWIDCMSTDKLQVRYNNGRITRMRSWEGGDDE